MQQIAAPGSFFNFHSEEKAKFFSNQRAMSKTKPLGLQHYCFFGKTDLHRLFGLW